MAWARRACDVMFCAAALFLSLAWQTPAVPAPPSAQETPLVRGPLDVPAQMTVAQARLVNDRSLAWIVSNQRADGRWGSGVVETLSEIGFSLETFHAWHLAANALCVLALMEAESTPERELALQRGLEYLCSAQPARRGSDWDVDYSWSALYGLVASVRAFDDARFSSPEWRAKITAWGQEATRVLLKNETPSGGWAYYDDPPFTERPKWATSFCTGLVLPSVARAQALGWIKDPAVQARARDYVRRCALPSGAYEYDLNPIPRVSGGEMINDIKGSLGRIQVCNWALASTGEKSVTADKLREGLGQFFEEHRFLDVARMRPIPHEAYYQNAGYFYYFGHYYAAQAINLLPEPEREALHAKLRPHLAKTQREDGSCNDFLNTSRQFAADTALMSLALSAGLPRAASVH
jgi:hypothetical protein